jgi:signal transduction histidine kinase
VPPTSFLRFGVFLVVTLTASQLIESKRRSEEALRTIQARLSRVTRFATVAELAASIAHEVSQPLNAVVANGQACMQWLSAEPPNLTNARVAAERIVRDGRDAGEVVRHIRALFRKTDLEKVDLNINEETFRADLYYRLSVFPISLPSLVNYFVRRLSRQLGKSIDQVPDGVMEILKAHHWPGNIRELQNFIERSVIVTSGRVLSPRRTELTLLMQAAVSAPTQTLSDAERAYILGILKETNWIVGGRDGAAARLRVPRTTLIGRTVTVVDSDNQLG